MEVYYYWINFLWKFNNLLLAGHSFYSPILVKSATKSTISNHQLFCLSHQNVLYNSVSINIGNRNWIIFLVTDNRKNCDLGLVIWLMTSPENWGIEWTSDVLKDINIYVFHRMKVLGFRNCSSRKYSFGNAWKLDYCEINY